MRSSSGRKVRQPLSRLDIPDFGLEDEFLKLIEEEINVKKVFPDPGRNKDIMNIGMGMELDIEITPELQEEGLVRDFIRNIQAKRKEMGLTPKDKIRVSYSENKEIIEKYAEQIKKQVIAEEVVFSAETPLTIDKL
jgi:isoleucyl-tRNA synthetase